MILNSMKIFGFRGFATQQSIEFAVPTSKEGSGLTIITGPNNSGKSSIVECLRLRHTNQDVTFTVGARNTKTDLVHIKYSINGNEETIRSINKGSSETVKENYNYKADIFVLPSRRAFNPYFSRSPMAREQYLGNYGITPQRSSTLTGFESRLFQILKNPSKFNELLYEILPSRPAWTIDQSDTGQYFLKFFNKESSHTSDGMGEGITSLFAIVDALYDSSPGQVVVIDEPELSLHPSLQKRLAKVFMRISSDRQIVLSTHSPYFVNLESLSNDGKIVRIVSGSEGTKICALPRNLAHKLVCLGTGNIYNPHVFGLDAKEIFFQEDLIIITEDQEDVVLLPKVAAQLGLEISGAFFGWGAGGAGNVNTFCCILQQLGFTKVSAILDNDKKNELISLRQRFPNFTFYSIPADDIRTKPARPGTAEKKGLLDSSLIIRDEYRDDMADLYASLKAYAER